MIKIVSAYESKNGEVHKTREQAIRQNIRTDLCELFDSKYKNSEVGWEQYTLPAVNYIMLNLEEIRQILRDNQYD